MLHKIFIQDKTCTKKHFCIILHGKFMQWAKFFTKEARITYINEYLNMYLWAYFVKKPLNYAKGRSLFDGNQNYIF